VEKDSEIRELNFEYIKSSHFRMIHVDGVIGAVTPSKFVHAAVFSERNAIPQRVFQRVDADGKLGEVIEEKTVTRGGVVRELEAGLIMSPDAAKALGSWLLLRVHEIEQLEIRKSWTG
jgi:hypothetical protein